jgi:hypothetical protein
MSIEAMKMALEALERGRPQIVGVLVQQDQDAAITALRTAIAEAEKQEPVAYKQVPVAWLDEYGNVFPLAAKQYSVVGKHLEPLFTTPPAAQRQWVGLTAKDLAEIPPSAYEGAIWADAKLKEKNETP